MGARGNEPSLLPVNAGKVTAFALGRPQFLPALATELSRRARADLRAKRYGFALIAINALEQLVEACGTGAATADSSSLAVFEEYAVTVIHLALATTIAPTPPHPAPVMHIAAAGASLCAHFIAGQDTLLEQTRLDAFLAPLLTLLTRVRLLGNAVIDCRAAAGAGATAAATQGPQALGTAGDDDHFHVAAALAALHGVNELLRKSTPALLVERWSAAVTVLLPLLHILLGRWFDAHAHVRELTGSVPLPPATVSRLLVLQALLSRVDGCLLTIVRAMNAVTAEPLMRPVLAYWDAHAWAPFPVVLHCMRLLDPTNVGGSASPPAPHAASGGDAHLYGGFEESGESGGTGMAQVSSAFAPLPIGARPRAPQPLHALAAAGAHHGRTASVSSAAGAGAGAGAAGTGLAPAKAARTGEGKRRVHLVREGGAAPRATGTAAPVASAYALPPPTTAGGIVVAAAVAAAATAAASASASAAPPSYTTPLFLALLRHVDSLSDVHQAVLTGLGNLQAGTQRPDSPPPSTTAPHTAVAVRGTTAAAADPAPWYGRPPPSLPIVASALDYAVVMAGVATGATTPFTLAQIMRQQAGARRPRGSTLPTAPIATTCCGIVYRVGPAPPSLRVTSVDALAASTGDGAPRRRHQLLRDTAAPTHSDVELDWLWLTRAALTVEGGAAMAHGAPGIAADLAARGAIAVNSPLAAGVRAGTDAGAGIGTSHHHSHSASAVISPHALAAAALDEGGAFVASLLVHDAVPHAALTAGAPALAPAAATAAAVAAVTTELEDESAMVRHRILQVATCLVRECTLSGMGAHVALATRSLLPLMVEAAVVTTGSTGTAGGSARAASHAQSHDMQRAAVGVLGELRARLTAPADVMRLLADLTAAYSDHAVTYQFLTMMAPGLVAAALSAAMATGAGGAAAVPPTAAPNAGVGAHADVSSGSTVAVPISSGNLDAIVAAAMGATSPPATASAPPSQTHHHHQASHMSRSGSTNLMPWVSGGAGASSAASVGRGSVFSVGSGIAGAYSPHTVSAIATAARSQVHAGRHRLALTLWGTVAHLRALTSASGPDRRPVFRGRLSLPHDVVAALEYLLVDFTPALRCIGAAAWYELLSLQLPHAPAARAGNGIASAIRPFLLSLGFLPGGGGGTLARCPDPLLQRLYVASGESGGGDATPAGSPKVAPAAAAAADVDDEEDDAVVCGASGWLLATTHGTERVLHISPTTSSRLATLLATAVLASAGASLDLAGEVGTTSTASGSAEESGDDAALATDPVSIVDVQPLAAAGLASPRSARSTGGGAASGPALPPAFAIGTARSSQGGSDGGDDAAVRDCAAATAAAVQLARALLRFHGLPALWLLLTLGNRLAWGAATMWLPPLRASGANVAVAAAAAASMRAIVAHALGIPTAQLLAVPVAATPADDAPPSAASSPPPSAATSAASLPPLTLSLPLSPSISSSPSSLSPRAGTAPARGALLVEVSMGLEALRRAGAPLAITIDGRLELAPALPGASLPMATVFALSEQVASGVNAPTASEPEAALLPMPGEDFAARLAAAPPFLQLLRDWSGVAMWGESLPALVAAPTTAPAADEPAVHEEEGIVALRDLLHSIALYTAPLVQVARAAAVTAAVPAAASAVAVVSTAAREDADGAAGGEGDNNLATVRVVEAAATGAVGAHTLRWRPFAWASAPAAAAVAALLRALLLVTPASVQLEAVATAVEAAASGGERGRSNSAIIASGAGAGTIDAGTRGANSRLRGNTRRRGGDGAADGTGAGASEAAGATSATAAETADTVYASGGAVSFLAPQGEAAAGAAPAGALLLLLDRVLARAASTAAPAAGGTAALRPPASALEYELQALERGDDAARLRRRSAGDGGGSGSASMATEVAHLQRSLATPSTGTAAIMSVAAHGDGGSGGAPAATLHDLPLVGPSSEMEVQRVALRPFRVAPWLRWSADPATTWLLDHTHDTALHEAMEALVTQARRSKRRGPDRGDRPTGRKTTRRHIAPPPPPPPLPGARSLVPGDGGQ